MNPTKHTGLNRRQLEFIALGGTIGAGLFLGAGQGIQIAGPGMILAYAVAGLMTFIVARCLGEMALNDAKPQIFVRYTERYLGRRAAFVQAWSYWICCILVCMAELTAAGLFLRVWFPTLPPWIAALAGLIVVFGINRLNVRVFGEIEFWMSLLKIVTVVGFLMLGALLLLGVGHYPGASVRNLWADGGLLPNGSASFLAALPVALFAFAGTEMIGIAAAETEQPERAVPRAINGLAIRLGLFYIGTTFMIVCLMPWRSVTTDSSPILSLFSHVGLPGAETFVTVVLISAVLSSCNTTLYAATRMLKILGEMGAAPAKLTTLNAHGAPGRAAALTLAIVSLSILFNYLLPAALFQLLLGMAAMVVILNWVLMLVAHIRFRKHQPAEAMNRFPVPGAPWSNYAIIVLLAAIIVIAAQGQGLRLALVLAGTLFAGLWLIASLWRRTARAKEA
jgi:D-serine/D-alanine/glycine transporter